MLLSKGHLEGAQANNIGVLCRLRLQLFINLTEDDTIGELDRHTRTASSNGSMDILIDCGCISFPQVDVQDAFFAGRRRKFDVYY